MFGKPEWFKEKTIGWGLVPVSWRGWVYTGGWSAAIALPFLTLLSLSRYPESLVWMVVSISALTLDVRSIIRQMRQKKERDALFYIGEESESQVSTENFDLQVRD